MQTTRSYIFNGFLLLALMVSSQVFAQIAKYSLDSDKQNVWMHASQAEIGRDSINIFKPGYISTNWVKATVPGTVFNDYVEAGLEKDPNFGDNIYKVDKKKYDRNFWYRIAFKTPANYQNDQKLWLNFEGVNRKADVYLNGTYLGKLNGFMDRGKFDISGLVDKTTDNILAVLVHWPQTPIPNYATPTYISSASWDWMPYVPGLLMGITDNVYLSTSGAVTLTDPWVRTKVPSSNKASLQLNVELSNGTALDKEGELTGVIQPGNISFSQKMKIEAYQQRTFTLDTNKFKQFIISNPKLWWPNGYGDPNLYTCELKFNVDGKVSDVKKISFGIREYSYDTIGNVFHISINGKRIFIKGGNWGMSEYLLRCRGEEYNLKLKLHKDMNLNMIRNWIGSVTDAEFYEACDKYGIMIWDDFWLNSHKNLPRDIFAFNHNAVEKIKRYRNHPSIAVWCGDNEGYPEPPLNGWLAENVKTFDAGDRWYQANSHSDALTGSGPWTNFDPQWYFTKYPGGFGGDTGWGMRTEIGTAVFTTFESFKKFMPEENWWPRNEMWNKHFFGESAANAGPDRYQESIDHRYGKALGIEDFCLKAQLLNIETNKALYEGWLHHMWNDASGVMTWMSQSAYPSFVWQTYDYYYDLNGAYWGVKKACEPLHIQWSYADNSVKVVNSSGKTYDKIKAVAEIYDIKGRKLKDYTKNVRSASNTAEESFVMDLYTIRDNLAYQKPVSASTTSDEAGRPMAVTDGNSGSRWTSSYTDNQWVSVDMGKTEQISQVTIEWEAAFAKSYKIQVSEDEKNWRDVFTEHSSDGGSDRITFSKTNARYVRMYALSRATQYGVSIYEFEIYKEQRVKSPEVQLIKLFLKDEKGNTLSDNFYWRSSAHNDYTQLNTLAPVNLKVSSKMSQNGGKKTISAKVTNASSEIAFAVKVQAVNAQTGERILPAMMNDDYFTLFKNESKDIVISFDSSLLNGKNYRLEVTPYNNRKR
ncbi:discoidin domain-containing protein [Desertivirga xinjiangensis]|uniref:discoidin domain-containing protein n=1 Tax=Desertivirga xinjiangensis TaxID=539206 RepID=UPI00210BD79F|nr:discoidin domain-containing protein [Pedobacter xinjiangensis]